MPETDGSFEMLLDIGINIMASDPQESRLLAKALHEIRFLLAPYLGSGCKADLQVREAAHLAYALHNEAQAAAEGHGFDVQAASAKIAAINNVLPDSDLPSRILSSESW